MNRSQDRKHSPSPQTEHGKWRRLSGVTSLMLGVVALLLTAVAIVPARTSAAGMPGMKGSVLVKQKVAGTYRLILRVGPAEKMEVMKGGSMATCSMAMSGMSMGKSCNHHLELHVHNARTGAVVTDASVTIVLQNKRTHQTINVPIMTMMDPKKGMRDYHYGNNIYAPPGRYTVTVHVNQVGTVFSIPL